jgi:hypothetical protein
MNAQSNLKANLDLCTPDPSPIIIIAFNSAVTLFAVHKCTLTIESYHYDYVVAQWLRHYATKPEGRGIDSRWCHWNGL